MPSGFAIDLPNDVLLDAGVLSVDGVIVGVSRGGLTAETQRVWQNVGFAGKKAPIVGLDRALEVIARIAGTFLQFGEADLARLEHAAFGTLPGAPSLSIAAAAALTVAAAAALSSSAIGVPVGASVLLGAGLYLADMRLTFARGGGGACDVVFPVALCTGWKLDNADPNAEVVSATFEARLDLTTSTDTDAMPYRVEITDP